MTRRVLCAAVALGLAAVSPPALRADVVEEEAPESAVSSPPMDLDDPGTPGRQGVEVNFVGSFVRAGQSRGSSALLDANFGIGDRIQLKYERPYVSEGIVGQPSQQGLGATEIGIKWRAIDHDGWAMALYPQYEDDDAFALKDEDGNPEVSEGRSVYFPILLSKVVHRVYTLGVNLGYRRNLEERGDDANLALGVGRAVGKDARVLAEVFSERDERLHNRQTDARVGYVFLLFPKLLEKSRLELPAYGSIGHSLGRTEEGERATSYTFGVSFIMKPKGES
jgi:hypothetical protein